jgi:2-phospho-L-lactate guanylyltransferase
MHVLLPLKEFAAAKQRLAGVLSAQERPQLFEAMVDDVLKVLTAHAAIEHVVICSRDRAAAWLAHYYQVEFLHEDYLYEQQTKEQSRNSMPCGAATQCGDLNYVVNAVAHRFAAQGITDLMVVHGDLPLLSASDISLFIERHHAQRGPAVTIAPDRRRSGTNLLAWRSLPTFTAQYGADSFQLHAAQARALQAVLTVCDLPGACFDIDEPDDLLLLAQNTQNSATRTMAFLRDSGVTARLTAMTQSINDRDNDALDHQYAENDRTSGERYGRAD